MLPEALETILKCDSAKGTCKDVTTKDSAGRLPMKIGDAVIPLCISVEFVLGVILSTRDMLPTLQSAFGSSAFAAYHKILMSLMKRTILYSVLLYSFWSINVAVSRLSVYVFRLRATQNVQLSLIQGCIVVIN